MEDTRENVFDFIKREETAFQSKTGIPVVDGWEFSMYEHIRKTVLYKYGQLANRVKTENDPVINIILPLLNVAYRTEDIDLKDILLYVNDKNNFHKSLLAKKFHDKWARDDEFDMDTFIDRLKESWIDFGLALVKKGAGKPEVVPLQRLAFCDQSDILSGPICEKHQYSPDQLLEMKGRWDDDAIDEIIALSREEKAQQQVRGQKQKTPGKYIEAYELHGMCPEDWNPKVENPDFEKYTRQLHVVTYYQGSDPKKRKGIALYQGSEGSLIYDALKRDEIYGRSCGYGGVEELFEAQVWHTFSAIQKKEMLETAAAMIVKTTDEGLAKRQRITDLEKGEMLVLDEGKDASQLFIQPVNWQAFDDWQDQMKLTAQTQASANDPQLGVEPKSGTPFGLQRLTTAQGQGIHEHRRGILATFLRKLYKKWFLKDVVAAMNRGDEWFDELDLNELQWVADTVATNWAEKKKKDTILSGKKVTQDEIDAYKNKVRKEWAEGGKERFFKIIKDEFKDIPVSVKINIANKQKNLDVEAEKILNFMRAIISTGGAMLQAPGMADLLNQVIERVGLDPVDWQVPAQPAPQQTPQAMPAPQPTA